ncbi:MAG: prepilin-type N-terminal cleavage/methylation domain-containing protein, partial [Planctomycetales bacterium]|nr:prepilin-type N-terminal cleavage/methylation domain-containing protein [Planctomycetales bacterium]
MWWHIASPPALPWTQTGVSRVMKEIFAITSSVISSRARLRGLRTGLIFARRSGFTLVELLVVIA